MGCTKTLFRFGNGGASKPSSGQQTAADGQPLLEPLVPEASAQEPRARLLTEPPASTQADVQAIILAAPHDELPGEFPDAAREEPLGEPLEEQDLQPVPSTSPCLLHPHHPPENKSGYKCCSYFQSLVGCFPLPCRLSRYYYCPCCDPYPQLPIEGECETTTASAPAASVAAEPLLSTPTVLRSATA